MHFYYHPESDSLWKQEIPLAEDETDGLIEEITYNEYREILLKQRKAGNMSFFDATNIEPSQPSGNIHPPGKKLPSVISSTCIMPSKTGDALMLVLSFTTPMGAIDSRYNLWNKNEQAVDIARRQLAAVCYSVGIYKLPSVPNNPTPADYENAGRELRNSRLIIDVDYQKGNEPTAEKPQGGYTEIKHVYDANGNEPGKAPVAQPQQGGWGGAGAQAQPPSQPATNGQQWGNQAQPAQVQPPQQAAQGWSPGPSTGGDKPAWVK